MRCVTALSLALAAAAAPQLGQSELEREFQKFVHDFGKVYPEEEREARFAAFSANYRYIAEENAKGNSYELGVTEFADMTEEEFRMTRFGFRAGKGPFEGLPYLGRHEMSNKTLPGSVDWTKTGAVTPVKNQGQCGSCWAFSTTGSLEGAWKIATGKLVSVSEQQLVDCSRSFGNEGCNGGEMDAGFQYAEANAMCTEDSYGYKGRDGICHATSCTTAIPKGGVVGYKDVEPKNEQAMMDAVGQQPVSIAIEADKLIFQLYRGGILSGWCGTRLDHGVLVVGYGTENGRDYWLVKNSWGAGWGIGGFVKLLRGKGGVGECGILTQPSYPVVKAASGVEAVEQTEEGTVFTV